MLVSLCSPTRAVLGCAVGEAELLDGCAFNETGVTALVATDLGELAVHYLTKHRFDSVQVGELW